MNVREKNAQYDVDVGNLYSKCEYCFKIILGKHYLLEKKLEGINYELKFCSIKCRSMFLYMIKQIHTLNNTVAMEELKYNRLKQEMTQDFEQIQRRRAYLTIDKGC